MHIIQLNVAAIVRRPTILSGDWSNLGLSIYSLPRERVILFARCHYIYWPQTACFTKDLILYRMGIRRNYGSLW